MKTTEEMKSELSSLVDEVVLMKSNALDRNVSARIVWLLAHITADVDLLSSVETYERVIGACAHDGGLAGG